MSFPPVFEETTMGLALRAVLARRVRAGELSLEAAGVLYQRFETMLADKLREVAGTRRAPAVELEGVLEAFHVVGGQWTLAVRLERPDGPLLRVAGAEPTDVTALDPDLLK